MLREWTLSQLELVKDISRVLVRDPLRLLPEADGKIHAFARDNGYTVIVAATNLVFRDLYERATSDPEVKKLLVIDRAPARRRAQPSITKAPPPFYPDLLEKIPEEARIELLSPPKALKPFPQRPWHEQRAGSLITLNSLAISIGVQLWLDLLSGTLRSSHWHRLSWQPGGGVEADYAAVDAATDCRICSSHG